MNWNGIISLLIACLEALLFINLLIFAEKNKLNRSTIVMVALLASYQAMEFLMCGIELQNPFFPYLAYVIISFLPPLNLLLVLTLTRNHNLNRIHFLIFLPAIFFVIYYAFIIPQFAVTACAVLYASYHYPLGEVYAFFYYLPILLSIILLISTVKRSLDTNITFISKVLLGGNIFISIPVVIGFALLSVGDYSLISKIESIMCKFAFVYAICLMVIALHNSNKKNERNNSEHIPDNK